MLPPQGATADPPLDHLEVVRNAAGKTIAKVDRCSQRIEIVQKNARSTLWFENGQFCQTHEPAPRNPTHLRPQTCGSLT